MVSFMKNKTANTLFWSAVERFSVQGIQFLLTIILTRLLLPADYGLVAMLNIFLVLGQVFVDSGFSTALIQKPHVSEKDFSTAFYFNIAIGVVVYVSLFLFSPIIADFFHEPKLEAIAQVAFLSVLVNSFAVVQRARLTIHLDFKHQAVASLVAVVVSGIWGIYLAYHGFGVWALVYQTLLNNILNVICLWIFARWFPKLFFSISSFQKLFFFGSKLLLAELISNFYSQLYSLVIGKKYSVSDLGYYNRSTSFASWFSSNFSRIISRAVYPIQCQRQNDNEKLKLSFLSYIRLASFMVFPFMLGLCVLAEPLVVCFFTEKWLPAVPLLRIVALAYMWDPIMQMSVSLLTVKGRSDYQLKSELIKKAGALGILILTIPFGLKWICIGLVAYSFYDLFIVTIYTRKVLQMNLRMILKAVFPILLLSCSMAMFIWCIISFIDSYWGQLIVGIIAGILFYTTVSFLAGFREIKLIEGMMRKES